MTESTHFTFRDTVVLATMNRMRCLPRGKAKGQVMVPEDINAV